MIQELLYLLLALAIPIFIAILISKKTTEPSVWYLTFASLVIVFINMLALYVTPTIIPTPFNFANLQWNWFGKIAGFITTLVVYFFLSKDQRRESGLFTYPQLKEWKSILVVIFGLLIFCCTVAYYGRDGKPVTLETVLFQATMPGLDEEALFRGTLLAILITAFKKPYHILGINLGWGSLPIVLFFGIAHGLFSHSITDSLITILTTGITGACLLWLKEKTSSIWIPVLVHNLFNICSCAVSAVPIKP